MTAAIFRMVARLSNIRILLVSLTFIVLVLIVVAILNLQNRRNVILEVYMKRFPNYFWGENETSQANRQLRKEVINSSKDVNLQHPESTKRTHEDTVDLQHELQIRLAQASEKKVMVLWHKPASYSGRVTFNRELCGNCEMTLDKNMINDSRTGAVVFHYNLVTADSMPEANTRNPNQLHILWHREPPTHFFSTPEAVNSDYKFNATASYGRMSDFYEIYNPQCIKIAKDRNESKSTIMKMKTKLAISMISNCGSNPGAVARLKIVRRLQLLGLAIDGYGHCFKNTPLKGNRQSVERHINQYKFFMSFENSYHCRDYITEKAYRNGINSLAVPIVWGATKEDYAAVLPVGSYIFAEDFDTLESLVDYIKYLDSNDTAYLSYFDWYQRELPLGSQPDRPGMYCQICRALHGINYDDRHRPEYDPVNPRIPTFTKGIAKRYMSSVKSYIFGDENPECIEKRAENWDFFKKWKLG